LLDVLVVSAYNWTSTEGNEMINIKLSAEQLALLLQVFDEQLSIGTFEDSEVEMAEEIVEILADAKFLPY